MQMLKMKKGDISITTIIVAAIALLVLIVMIAIFSGKINIFSQGYSDSTTSAKQNVCGANGGICMPEGECSGGGPSGTNWIDCSSTEVCCWANN